MGESSSKSVRRSRSREFLLEEIERRGSTTRSVLATETGLSISTVAEIVEDLIHGGLVVESVDRSARRGPGRPPAIIHPAPVEGYVGAIDFSHAYVRVALSRGDGTLVADARVQADINKSADMALDLGTSVFKKLAAKHRIGWESLRAVGAGVPAPLDAHGEIRSATILNGWLGHRPQRDLEERLGLPVIVANDAETGAIGEQRFGVAQALSDFIYVRASHGIGASIVLNGTVYRGLGGAAGEIGHAYLADSQDMCRCGRRGCLEASVSVDKVRELLDRTQLNNVAGTDEIDLATVDAHPIGAQILADSGRALGRVLAGGCTWLNPQAVIVGGELGVSGRSFLAGIRESLDRFAEATSAEAVTVHPAGLGTRSELMGAVALALKQVKADSVR